MSLLTLYLISENGAVISKFLQSAYQIVYVHTIHTWWGKYFVLKAHSLVWHLLQLLELVTEFNFKTGFLQRNKFLAASYMRIWTTNNLQSWAKHNTTLCANDTCTINAFYKHTQRLPVRYRWWLNNQLESKEEQCLFWSGFLLIRWGKLNQKASVLPAVA